MHKENITDKSDRNAEILNLGQEIRTKFTLDEPKSDDKPFFGTSSDISDSSEDLVTWRSNQGAKENIWKKELNVALMNYPLKHFYPEVHDLIAMTLQVIYLSICCYHGMSPRIYFLYFYIWLSTDNLLPKFY